MKVEQWGEPPKEKHITSGKVKCDNCRCVFEFEERDMNWHANIWGVGVVAEITCPNKSCNTMYRVADERFCLFRWFNLSYGKWAKFVK